MATLEALGELNKFEAIFDLSHYYTHRSELLRPLSEKASNGNPADQEVLSLLKAAGLSYPPSTPDSIKWLTHTLRRVKWKLQSIVSRSFLNL